MHLYLTGIQPCHQSRKGGVDTKGRGLRTEGLTLCSLRDHDGPSHQTLSTEVFSFSVRASVGVFWKYLPTRCIGEEEWNSLVVSAAKRHLAGSDRGVELFLCNVVSLFTGQTPFHYSAANPSLGEYRQQDTESPVWQSITPAQVLLVLFHTRLVQVIQTCSLLQTGHSMSLFFRVQ